MTRNDWRPVQDSQGVPYVGEGRDLEITGLHQQLAALLMLKDALNSENLELQVRIKAESTTINWVAVCSALLGVGLRSEKT